MTDEPIREPDAPVEEGVLAPPALQAAVTPPPPAAVGGPTSWPASWGTPPPIWAPPIPVAAERPHRRAAARPLVIVGATMLVAGIAAGAIAADLTGRNGNGSSMSTATVAVDSKPVTASAAGSAVSVAQQLGPAVGTIIASGVGSTGQNATGLPGGSPRGGSGSGASLGSGFVISNADQTSYLLTNNHVVEGATSLRVIMPGGKNLVATLVGTDKIDDLAVVSVKDGSLPQAVFGDSTTVQVGQDVVAIGSPLGNQGSVTSGVVSALHRTISAGSSDGTGATETLQDVLQTDAPISPGNSGGPLADAQGRVVGVNVAVSGQGNNIGFSIPSDVAQPVATSLIRGEKIGHPFIGVGIEDNLTATEAGHPFDGPGVLVATVRSGSPAEQAGVHQGDVIVKIDGVVLDNGETVGGLVQRHKVGDSVPFSLRRGGQTVDVKVTLAERPTGL